MDGFGKCRDARLTQNVSDPGDQCKEQGGMCVCVCLSPGHTSLRIPL